MSLIKAGHVVLVKAQSPVSKLGKDIYRHPRYKKWRKAVYKRDSYTCQLCGAKDCPLEAHHIKKKSIFSNLIFVVDNGICVCKTCHEDYITGNEIRFEKIFQAIVKKNKEAQNVTV